MSYKSVDTSVRSGAPVEFYKFGVSYGCPGDGEPGMPGDVGAAASDVETVSSFFYTNDNVVHEYDGKEYVPANVRRSAIEVTSVIDSLVTVDIDLPITDKLAQLYCLLKMPLSLDVDIFRWHRGTSLSSDVKRIWSGQATGYTVRNNIATINTQSTLQANLRLSTKQVVCQASCNHRLYDARCKVNKADYTYDAIVNLVRGTKIFVDDDHAANHDLRLGKIVNNRTLESRIITDNASNVISVTYDFLDIVAGDSVTISHGCDKAYSTCQAKFNNLENFGGFKWLPIDNPYDQGN